MAKGPIDVITYCPQCGWKWVQPYTGFGPKQTQQLAEWHSYICLCGAHVAVSVWFIRGRVAHLTVTTVWRKDEPEAREKSHWAQAIHKGPEGESDGG